MDNNYNKCVLSVDSKDTANVSLTDDKTGRFDYYQRKEIDFCAAAPCVHGTCTSELDRYSCTCDTGWEGTDCDTDIDECTTGTDNCDIQATCTNTVGSHNCTCNTGYTGDGVTCSDINECTAGTNNCHTQATCTNTDGSYICTCDTGYTGDGVTCTDINECTAGTDNCHTQLAMCTNTDGSFICTCNTGYMGDGVTCSDVDECYTNADNCHIHATCSNMEGSFNCSCDSGYQGNGTWCTEQNVPGVPVVGIIVGVVAGVFAIGAVGAVVFYCRRTNKNVPKRRDVPLKDITDQPVAGGATNESFDPANSRDTSISGLSNLTTVEDVQKFLIDNGLQECARAFRENDVDGEALRHLDNAMMKDLVPMVGPRARLKALLQKLNGSEIQISSDSPISTHNFWEIPRSSLSLGRRLGRGQFGEVRLGEVRNRRVTTTVAVKTLRDSASDSDKKDLLGELEILVTVGRHDNIISLVGACTKGGPLMIVVEYAPNGCLRDWLKTNSIANSEYQNQPTPVIDLEQLIQFGIDVSAGMSHLAAVQCVHRDLAARNILLGKNLVAKVSDFGLSRDIYESEEYVKTTQTKLPLRWMAYESLFYNVYTTQSDVWSFGVLLWEIMSMGHLPYGGMKGKRMMDMIKDGGRLEKPLYCPDELFALMEDCWTTLPEDRPTFPQLKTNLDRIIQAHKPYASLLHE
ncbi:PREDICTED: fibroblast growth factor receptor-like [Branchiostoma belcheri]|uniref:receptor protein-tyrosine kinase n=1 Tax=Branchiostoma belcheri TaxID=7741 RepID=A0A6P4ZVM1_BRABE|nr:PREDICTED: fibroblast growth factor receptor-like [Branchiostoma belcheri]